MEEFRQPKPILDWFSFIIIKFSIIESNYKQIIYENIIKTFETKPKTNALFLFYFIKYFYF